jgi:cytochrome c biogenesis protein CcdA/thiol-disulfide isomerase/thioredoxin
VVTILFVIVFIAGLLTILSPCVLPVVPLVFARSDRGFRREIVPMLAGLALMFVITASVGIGGAKWVTDAGEVGRIGAIALLGVLGVSLLSPAAAEWLARPIVLVGSWIEARAALPATRSRDLTRQILGPSRVLRNVAIGAAIGLLWAPCAGPILGLVIAGAALHGASATTVGLLFTFGLGAATSLAVAILGGRALLVHVSGYLRSDRWIRRGLGLGALTTLFVIASGRDAQLFAGGGIVNTARAEESLLRRVPNRRALLAGLGRAERRPLALPDEGPFPGFAGGTGWINTAPLAPDALTGKVMLVNFWTFSCYNCLNALPHIKAIEATFRDRGLLVVGVHTPELAHERVEANVRRAVRDLGIVYPVVIDGSYAIWNAFGNEYWPAVYLVDAHGRVRYHHFGEGAYDDEERAVDALLQEASAAAMRHSHQQSQPGAERIADLRQVRFPVDAQKDMKEKMAAQSMVSASAEMTKSQGSPASDCRVTPTSSEQRCRLMAEFR